MPVKMLPVAVLSLLIAGISLAQDASPPATDKGLSGRLEAAQSTEIRAELQAYSGELRLKWLAAPGAQLGEGERVAELEAPELAEALEKAREALQAAEWSLQALQDSAEQHQAGFPEQYTAGQRRLERAREGLEHFREYDRARRIRGAEMNLESRQHGIEDQKEELAQLKQLYDMNNLARESQDIVLNRAMRRLAQAEEGYAMAVEDHKRFLEVTLPRQEEDLVAALRSAELEMARLETMKERGNVDLQARLVRAERSLSDARQALEKLERDAAALVITASHAGVFAGGGDGISPPAKVGDRLSRNATLGSVLNTSTLHTTVQISPAQRAGLQPGASVSVRSDELDADGSGKVVLVGVVVRDGKVAARIEIDNASGTLLAGARVNVTLPDAGTAE